MLIDLSFIQFVVPLLFQLQQILGLADQRVHASKSLIRCGFRSENILFPIDRTPLSQHQKFLQVLVITKRSGASGEENFFPLEV